MAQAIVYVSGMPIPPPAPKLAPVRRGYAMILMIVSSVIISFGGLIVRSMEEAGPSQINFWRSLALIVTFGSIFLFRHRRQSIRNFRKVRFGGLLAGASLTVAGLAFMQALAHTTVANTMFTLASIPFITAGLAWIFLRENLSHVTVGTMVVAAAGVIMMVMDGIGLGSIYGNLMALLTALGFSGFAVVVRRNRHIDMLPALIISAVLILLVSTAVSYDNLIVPWKDIALCFLWGSVFSGLGNVMFVAASKHLVAGELTLFMLLEFALSPLWVWLVVNEAPTTWALAGGMLVIGAVAIRAIIEMQSGSRIFKRGRPNPA